RMEIEKWLRSFFADLHWKLHARLRKSSLVEKGISLLFGVLYDHELYFVQTGRIFAIVTDAKKIRSVGKDWKNYQVQSQKGLQLFGYEDSDLTLKPNRLYLAEKQRLIVLSGELAQKILPRVSDPATIDTLIESYAGEDNPLWLVLEGRERLIKPRSRKLSRVQISSIVLISLTLLTAIYMVFGNRILDQLVYKSRLSFQKEKITRLEQIPTTLKINTDDIRKYMDRIVSTPARNVSMEVAWNTELPYVIKLSPAFSLDKIYLVADSRMMAFDKKNRQLLWSKSFDVDIRSVLLSHGNLLISLDNQQVYGLKDDGSEIWQQNLPTESIVADRFVPCEIRSSSDPRLDKSIVVIPSRRGISIIDPNSGETLSSITLKQDLQALSAYDSYDNCFYAVVDGAILCIELKILN
ncbi:MAG: PQQ-binding-like beta-propeller repeat protein, partial [Candidatus Cloacimonetes bacterium]|nr:PQQ-binding-like beta-propeller repeat protein [Candidatus Cloacimonadota bacterium]